VTFAGAESKHVAALCGKAQREARDLQPCLGGHYEDYWVLVVQGSALSHGLASGCVFAKTIQSLGCKLSDLFETVRASAAVTR
jgi:hypothetical protein